MERAEKQKVVEGFKEKFAKASGVFVADYRGLTVDQVNNLRKAFRTAGVEYRVIKNTMFRRAVAGTALEGLTANMKGMTAVAIANKDAVTAAKAAMDFSKVNETFKIRAGFVEGQLLAADGVKTLSTLPSQAEIRATLLGLINTPAAKLMAQINAPAQNVVGVIQAKVEEDEKKAA